MFYMDCFFSYFQKNNPGKIVILHPELGQKLMIHDSSIPKNQLYDIKDAILIFFPFCVGNCWNLMVTVHPNMMKSFVEHSKWSMEYDQYINPVQQEPLTANIIFDFSGYMKNNDISRLFNRMNQWLDYQNNKNKGRFSRNFSTIMESYIEGKYFCFLTFIPFIHSYI